MTLYYNNAASDGDLGNLANWWQDAGFSTPALDLPGAGDTASVLGDASANNSGGASPSTLLINTGNFSAPVTLSGSPQHLEISGGTEFTSAISFTEDGTALFNGTTAIDGSVSSSGDLEVIFDDSAALAEDGVVGGNATFQSLSSLQASLVGNATFKDQSTMASGTVGGNATFEDQSTMVSGAVLGDVTSSGPGQSQIAGGTIGGVLTLTGAYVDGVPAVGATGQSSTVFNPASVTFNDNANTASELFWTDTGSVWVFNSQPNNGEVTGNMLANGTATNNGGTVAGTLFVAGVRNDDGSVSPSLSQADLGTYGTLAITGIPPGGGGARPILQPVISS